MSASHRRAAGRRRAVVKNVQKGKTTYTKQKRSQDELNKIRELAEAAIGFDAKRGDTISVQNMSFDGNSLRPTCPPGNLDHSGAKDSLGLFIVVAAYVASLLFMLAYLLCIQARSEACPECEPAGGARCARTAGTHGRPGAVARRRFC
jgi:flagellar biosynthesis/type III secretory pathway M-ring protein FliF/YscJ